MNRELFWRIVFYISWGTLALWVFLKSVGIIKTPFWLEFSLPAAGVVIGIFSLYHNIMENIVKLTAGFATLSTKFDHLEQQVGHLKEGVKHLDVDMEFVKKKLTAA